MKISKKWFLQFQIVIIIFLMGLIVGLFLNPVKKTVSKITESFNEKRLPLGYKFINPLLECDANTTSVSSINPLYDSLSGYIKKAVEDKKISYASIYYRDLNNGTWVGVYEHSMFSPASLLKVPLMMASFKRAQIYNDLDMNISKIDSDPTGDIISLKDYSSVFRILYNASYLNHDSSENALSLLSQSTFKNALVAGVPAETVVAHKFGERFH